ncbi:hypothetical protein ABIC60_004921 [Phyllobacterium ifriqiyense]
MPESRRYCRCRVLSAVPATITSLGGTSVKDRNEPDAGQSSAHQPVGLTNSAAGPPWRMPMQRSSAVRSRLVGRLPARVGSVHAATQYRALHRFLCCPCFDGGAVGRSRQSWRRTKKSVVRLWRKRWHRDVHSRQCLPVRVPALRYRDGAAGAEAHIRRKCSQEDTPTCRNWAPMPNISDDRCSDVVTSRLRRALSACLTRVPTRGRQFKIRKAESRSHCAASKSELSKRSSRLPHSSGDYDLRTLEAL